MSKLERLVAAIPQELNPSRNPVLNALLEAWATGDEAVAAAVEATNASLFVRTAEGSYLDRLAANYGVTRPSELGLLDADFQALIPNLSLKAKQVVRAFYDVMDVFWSPRFSRANVLGTIDAPFAVSAGDTFEVTVDRGEIQRVTVTAPDVQSPGFMTAKEAVRVLSRIEGITAEVIATNGGGQRVAVRTNTPGPRGSLFFGGTAALGIEPGRLFLVTDLAQRCVVYQVRAGEVVIEIPAVVPTLRRTLRGSHHFHADATLEGPVPPANGVWAGSFVFSRTQNPFVVSKTRTTLGEAVVAGDVITELTVASTVGFPPSGNLIFDFGLTTQEQPVPYLAVPNTNTILVDPGYSFQNTHEVGSSVNLLAPGFGSPYQPRKSGIDLAVFLTSPANSRSVVQELLLTLAAAGVVVTFVILLPKYTYIEAVANPYA